MSSVTFTHLINPLRHIGPQDAQSYLIYVLFLFLLFFGFGLVCFCAIVKQKVR